MRRGEWQRVEDNMIEEDAVSLVVGGEVCAVLMATPGLERELGAGFAVTMGWVSPHAALAPTVWDPKTRRVELAIPRPRDFDPQVKAVGGGPMGPTRAEPLHAEFSMELETVLGFTSVLFEGQRLFAHTSATHAVALFDGSGRVMYVAEDAGRHNALDKAVGLAWLAKDLTRVRAAAFSGRMSLEMVLKAARAGLALLVSVSAPSGPAVRAARELNLTLAGFARKRDLNIYTHAGRIVQQGRPVMAAPGPGPAD